MKTLILSLFLLLLVCLPVQAAVELARDGQPPEKIDEVYLRDGVSFVAIEDVLPPLGLSGSWDAVEHVYRISSPRGTATISPGSRFLKIGERFIPLKEKPRFIDSRLRVSEEFVTRHMPDLVGERIYYRNLDPRATADRRDGNALDRLFSFLLRKKKATDGPALRGVAIDPGHGGQDPGAIGISGIKEKDVTLAVARRLQRQINMQLGIPIYLSRDDDYGLTTEERFQAATRQEIDALLLLHAQAAPDYKPQGIYLYVRRSENLPGESMQADDKDSLRLAENLAAALRDAGLVVRGVSEAPLYPLGQGDLPTVLVEMGYLTNPGDRLLLNEEEGQKKIASALYNGLKSFGEGRRIKENGGSVRYQ